MEHGFQNVRNLQVFVFVRLLLAFWNSKEDIKLYSKLNPGIEKLASGFPGSGALERDSGLSKEFMKSKRANQS